MVKNKNILILMAFFLANLFAFSINSYPQIFNQKSSLMIQAEKFSGDIFPIFTKTPLRVNVYSSNKVSNEMLSEIDKGFTKLFALARKNRYGKYLNYSDYTIFVAKPDRLKSAAGDYSPDIAVSAAQYAGTDYDKGGYIYVAGLVLGYRPAGFLIAEHTKNLARVSDLVSYEGEHIILYHNDRKRYNETMDHSKGGGHPILH